MSFEYRQVVPIFLLLLTASPGFPILSLTDCPRSGGCNGSPREVDSSCFSLQLCCEPECCRNQRTVPASASTQKLAGENPVAQPVDDAASSGLIRRSLRIASAGTAPAAARTSHLFSLHCAFLI